MKEVPQREGLKKRVRPPYVSHQGKARVLSLYPKLEARGGFAF